MTESFIIYRIDSGGYTLTLEPSLVAGVADIRSHLSVVKDPADTDIDGPIVGYAGTGTFTVPDDLSDNWLVTLSVPDTSGY